MENKELDDVFDEIESATTNSMPQPQETPQMAPESKIEVYEEIVEDEYAIENVEQPVEEDIIEEIIEDDTVIEEEVNEPIEDEKPEIIEEIETEPEGYSVEEDGTIIVTTEVTEVISDEGEGPVISPKEASVLYKTVSIDNPLLFGKSKLNPNVRSQDDALSILRGLKHYGEYIDVYLPESKIAIRIFEFDNTVFLNDTIDQVREMYLNLNLLGTVKEISVSKKLLNLIRENSVFLCKDGEISGAQLSFDNLSNKDIPLILLGAAAMLIYVDSGKKDYMYEILDDSRCSKCGTPTTIKIDLLKLFKEQYSKLNPERDEELKSYSMEETFMEKLESSNHNKKTAITIKKGSGDDMTIIKTVIGDPSYASYKSLEEDIYKYLINKYFESNVIKEYTRMINSFNLLSNTRKVGIIINAINNREFDMDSDGVLKEFMDDFAMMRLLPYITREEVKSKATKGQFVITEFSAISVESKLKHIRLYPPALIKGIVEKVTTKIQEESTQLIDIKYSCGKCGHEAETSASPLLFFFYVISSLIPDQE